MPHSDTSCGAKRRTRSGLLKVAFHRPCVHDSEAGVQPSFSFDLKCLVSQKKRRLVPSPKTEQNQNINQQIHTKHSQVHLLWSRFYKNNSFVSQRRGGFFSRRRAQGWLISQAHIRIWTGAPKSLAYPRTTPSNPILAMRLTIGDPPKMVVCLLVPYGGTLSNQEGPTLLYFACSEDEVIGGCLAIVLRSLFVLHWFHFALQAAPVPLSARLF